MREDQMPRQPFPMFKYTALICGGLGPDVWDKEISFEAEDFLSAAQTAQKSADFHGGAVVSLEQTE